MRDALAVVCPVFVCSARRGAPCITKRWRAKDGYRFVITTQRDKPHAARVRAAEREERGEEKEREAHIAEISTRETLNDD